MGPGGLSRAPDESGDGAGDAAAHAVGGGAADDAAPAWLFLPGMMCDERLFAPQLAALGDRVEAHAARFDAGDTIEAFARAALALVPPPRRVVLVGLSMGGIVAMQLLALAPHRVAGVVLLDTNPYAEGPERRELRVPQIERALAGDLDALLVEEMKPLYLAPANRDDESLLALVLDMARSLGPDVFARQSRALAARADLTGALRAWHGPAAIACGAHDALCPPERHAAMHALMPQATLDVVPGAGHLPTLERPGEIDRVLERMLVAVTASRTLDA